MNVLERLILENLSFYEPISLEKLLLDFDQEVVEDHRELTVDDLKSELERLMKRKKVVKEVIKGREYYKKIVPKRGVKRKLLSFFNKGNK